MGRSAEGLTYLVEIVQEGKQGRQLEDARTQISVPVQSKKLKW